MRLPPAFRIVLAATLSKNRNKKMSNLTDCNYSGGIVIENRKNGVVVTPFAPGETLVADSMVFNRIDDLVEFVRANVRGAHGEVFNSEPNTEVARESGE